MYTLPSTTSMSAAQTTDTTTFGKLAGCDAVATTSTFNGDNNSKAATTARKRELTFDCCCICSACVISTPCWAPLIPRIGGCVHTTFIKKRKQSTVRGQLRYLMILKKISDFKLDEPKKTKAITISAFSFNHCKINRQKIVPLTRSSVE